MDQTEDVWVADNEMDSWELLDKSYSEDEDFEIIQQLCNKSQNIDSPKKNSLINLADTILFQNENDKEQITNVLQSNVENDNDQDYVEKPRKRNNLKPRKNILKPLKNKSRENLEQLERRDIQKSKEKLFASKFKAQNEEKKKKFRSRLGGLSLATILTAFGLSLIYLKPALDITNSQNKPILHNSNTDIAENTAYSFDEKKLYHEYKPKPKMIKENDRKIKQLIREFDVKPIKKESKPTYLPSCKSFGPKNYEAFMKEFAKENSCHKDDMCQKSDPNKLIPKPIKSKLQSTSLAKLKIRDIITSIHNCNDVLTETLNATAINCNNDTCGATKSIHTTNCGLQHKCYISKENLQPKSDNKINPEVFYSTSKPNKNSAIATSDQCLLIDELLKECTSNDRQLKKLNRAKNIIPKPNSKTHIEDLLHFVKTYKKITKQIEHFSHEQSRVIHKLERAVFRQKYNNKIEQQTQIKVKKYEDNTREQTLRHRKTEINESEFQNNTFQEKKEFMKPQGEKVMMDILRVTIQNKIKNGTKPVEESAIKDVEKISYPQDECKPKKTENSNLCSISTTVNKTKTRPREIFVTREEEDSLQNQVKVNKYDCWKKAVKNVKDEEQKRFIKLPDKCNPQKTWIKKIEF